MTGRPVTWAVATGLLCCFASLTSAQTENSEPASPQSSAPSAPINTLMSHRSPSCKPALCFQSLPRYPSHNPFPFLLLHCCPEVDTPWGCRTESVTLTGRESTETQRTLRSGSSSPAEPQPQHHQRDERTDRIEQRIVNTRCPAGHERLVKFIQQRIARGDE